MDINPNSLFNAFVKLNQSERINNRYNLSDKDLMCLNHCLIKEYIRFPTTFNIGLIKTFPVIGSDGKVINTHTLNSCYAGYIPETLDDLISHIKTYNYRRIGAHGMNGDLLPINETMYTVIGSFSKQLSESLVTLCISIWNISILELFEFLHPSRKIEGINFAILVTEEFKQAVNNKGLFKLYRATKSQIVKQTHDERECCMKIDAVTLYNKLLHCIQDTSVSVINIDKMNERNMNKHLGKVTCTNICTEILPVGDFACTLGSINLHTLVKDNQFNWKRFEKATSLLVKTLNVSINVTTFTSKTDVSDFNKKVLRPIGIGVTGYANCLIDQNICYEDSNEFAYRLFSTFLCKAVEISTGIGKSNPELIPQRWCESEWAKGKLPIDMWSDKELSKINYIKNDIIEYRLSKTRDSLKQCPMVNCNLIAHMPTLRRGITKNMCLSLTPLHSLVTELSTETSRVTHIVRGLPEDQHHIAVANKGVWSPEFDNIFKTSEFMDQQKILNIYYIAQLFCDMSISITPHFNNNNTETIYNFLMKSYNLNTPLYYMRLDIISKQITHGSNDSGDSDDKCKGGMCQV